MDDTEFGQRLLDICAIWEDLRADGSDRWLLDWMCEVAIDANPPFRARILGHQNWAEEC